MTFICFGKIIKKRKCCAYRFGGDVAVLLLVYFEQICVCIAPAAVMVLAPRPPEMNVELNFWLYFWCIFFFFSMKILHT